MTSENSKPRQSNQLLFIIVSRFLFVYLTTHHLAIPLIKNISYHHSIFANIHAEYFIILGIYFFLKKNLITNPKAKDVSLALITGTVYCLGRFIYEIFNLVRYHQNELSSYSFSILVAEISVVIWFALIWTKFTSLFILIKRKHFYMWAAGVLLGGHLIVSVVFVDNQLRGISEEDEKRENIKQVFNKDSHLLQEERENRYGCQGSVIKIDPNERGKVVSEIIIKGCGFIQNKLNIPSTKVYINNQMPKNYHLRIFQLQERVLQGDKAFGWVYKGIEVVKGHSKKEINSEWLRGAGVYLLKSKIHKNLGQVVLLKNPINLPKKLEITYNDLHFSDIEKME